MYHYTYMITVKNPTDARRMYIGVRSCKINPQEDNYYGSCRPFKKWQKEHGTDNLHKQVLCIWETRQEALSHEILLHDCFDVGVNLEFWNQAKQKTSGFDTTGTTHEPYNKGMKWTDEQRRRVSESRKGHPTSEETKRKIRDAQKGKKLSEEHRLKLCGRKLSPEHIEKLRLAKIGYTPWSKGKTFTDAHKAKLAVAKLGKASWNKGRSWSEEERKKLSESAKNRKVDRQRNEKGQYL